MFRLRWLLLSLALAVALAVPTIIVVIANWQQMPAIMKALGSPTSAAWVQGVGSLVAVAVALYVPLRERHLAREERDARRLSVVTTRRDDIRYLQVEFAYEPEDRNVGFEVRARLVTPDDAVLVRAIRHTEHQIAGGRSFTAVNADNIKDLGRAVRVALGWLASDPDEKLRADIWIGKASGEVEHAELDVAIWTTANPRRLLRRRFAVSPSVEPPRTYGVLPMSPVEGSSI